MLQRNMFLRNTSYYYHFGVVMNAENFGENMTFL